MMASKKLKDKLEKHQNWESSDSGVAKSIN